MSSLTEWHLVYLFSLYTSSVAYQCCRSPSTSLQPFQVYMHLLQVLAQGRVVDGDNCGTGLCNVCRQGLLAVYSGSPCDSTVCGTDSSYATPNFHTHTITIVKPALRRFTTDSLDLLFIHLSSIYRALFIYAS